MILKHFQKGMTQAVLELRAMPQLHFYEPASRPWKSRPRMRMLKKMGDFFSAGLRPFLLSEERFC
jgi:hypothetical protein